MWPVRAIDIKIITHFVYLKALNMTILLTITNIFKPEPKPREPYNEIGRGLEIFF